MPWTYRQSSGELRYNGVVIETGYSGAGTGKNNPGMQHISNEGPIPRGLYRISNPHNSHHTGPFTLDLTPVNPSQTFGRTALKMHGDSISHPGQASNGCIIMRMSTRTTVWTSTDHMLEVIQ